MLPVGKPDLRIDLVAPFPPPYGGMGVRFERLTEILTERGYCCRKVSIPWADWGGSRRRLRRLAAFTGPAWSVLHSDAHIVHTVTGSIPNAFAVSTILLAGRLSGRKVLLSIGGGDFGGFSRQAPLIQRRLLGRLLSLAHFVLPCNAELEESLLRLRVDRKRIMLISNALPDELGVRARQALSEDFLAFRRRSTPLLLYVGGLQAHYGLLDALEALAVLRERWPQAGLAVFVKEGGDTGYARVVQAAIRQKKLDQDARIYRSVPWAVAAMREADAMLRATNLSDGDSRAVREALAVGLPVIASNVGHRPPGVRLYPAGDAAALAQAVAEILQSAPSRAPFVDPEGERNIHRIETLYHALVENFRASIETV